MNHIQSYCVVFKLINKFACTKTVIFVRDNDDLSLGFLHKHIAQTKFFINVTKVSTTNIKGACFEPQPHPPGALQYMSTRHVPVDRPPILIAPIPNDPLLSRTDTY